ncbi:MAG: arabinosyltransferase domain-containing protein, partial [Sciscionella sp.]
MGATQVARPRPDEHPGERDATAGEPSRWVRMVLVALAVAGTLAALLLPLLPVNQSVVTVRWPTERFGTAAVQAPFTGYQPVWFLAEIPCQSVRDLPARSTGPATLVDTTPPNAEYGYLSGLSVRLADSQLSVFDQGRLLWRALVPRRGCAVSVSSDASRTTVSLGDRRVVDDAGDHRPLFTGIYSDLDARRDNTAGLDVRARADNRFDNVATPLKGTAIAVSLLAVVTSLVLLRRMDGVRRAPGRRWRRWLRGLTGRDVTVAAVLALWTVVGPVTSDDGYTLSMVRARVASGYIGNYFRWFDTPEAPFGWFYDLYAGWAQISTATVWMRVPALLMGIGTWLLLSKALLPRLGERVATSRLATWSAAAAFVMFWLGYDHGLRPEPVVVLFSLLVLCAVERALATGRLLPVAVALIAAGLSVAATPTGLIALLPFVVAAAPLIRLLRARIASAGAWTTFAPLAAAGTGVLVVVFYNQTLRALLEGA